MRLPNLLQTKLLNKTRYVEETGSHIRRQHLQFRINSVVKRLYGPGHLIYWIIAFLL